MIHILLEKKNQSHNSSVSCFTWHGCIRKPDIFPKTFYIVYLTQWSFSFIKKCKYVQYIYDSIYHIVCTLFDQKITYIVLLLVNLSKNPKILHDSSLLTKMDTPAMNRAAWHKYCLEIRHSVELLTTIQPKRMQPRTHAMPR